MRVHGRLGKLLLPKSIGDRNFSRFREFYDLGMRFRVNGATTHVEQGLFGFLDGFGHALNLPGMAFGRGLVAAEFHFVWKLVVPIAEEDVFGQIDQDRTRPSRARNVESLLNGLSKIICAFHQIVVLGDGSVMPTMSASWKASLPTIEVATWPVKHTMGIESM